MLSDYVFGKASGRKAVIRRPSITQPKNFIWKAKLKKLIDWLIFKTEGVSHAFISHFTFNYIGAEFDFRILFHGLFPAFVGDFHRIGQSGIGKRQGGGFGYSARHVGHGVVDDAFDLVDRLRMRRRLDRLDAAALVDSIRDICKVRGEIEFTTPASLPNDGKVIDDIRKYD